jgi:hypothetical protein
MGFLSARNAATLPPAEYPACPEGTSRVVGRDIRARIEGYRDSQPIPRLSSLAMSHGIDPPTLCRGARGNSRARL